MGLSFRGRRGSVRLYWVHLWTENQKGQKTIVNQCYLAERVGFEPTVRLPLQRFFETALLLGLPLVVEPRWVLRGHTTLFAKYRPLPQAAPLAANQDGCEFQDLNLRLPNPGRFRRTSEGDSKRLAVVGKGGSAPPLPSFPTLL